MDLTPVNLEDYTCSICREIFQSPVSLSCPHTYCQSCIIGLKKPATTADEPDASPSLPPPTSSSRSGSMSHSSRVHQPNQCFICAICRQESMGYVRYRELDQQLNTLQALCPTCSDVFSLNELRKHSETCLPMKSNRETKPTQLKTKLSESQAKALQKAQEGENRSTFSCPFCERANFSLNHLRQHIKKRHKQEDQRRVCPICSSMPWGDKTMVSSNIYQHIKSRHQFDYDTYVNFEQDEAAMMREALQASLLDH